MDVVVLHMVLEFFRPQKEAPRDIMNRIQEVLPIPGFINPFDVPYHTELGIDLSKILGLGFGYAETICINKMLQSVPISEYKIAKNGLDKSKFRLRVIWGQLMNEIREFGIEPPRRGIKVMGYHYNEAKEHWISCLKK